MYRCLLLLALPACVFAAEPKDKPDLKPTRLTMSLQQQTAAQMLKVIGEQAGCKLVLVGDDKRKHDLTLRDDTFWEAIHKLERQTGYAPSYYYQKEGLHFTKPEATLPHVFNQGLVRLEITHIHEDRDIVFGDPFKKNGAREHLLTFTYRVWVEPRYQLWDTGRIEPKSILDETKQPFTQVANAFVKEEQEEQAWSDKGTITATRKDYLARMNANAKTIKQLRGVLPLKLVVAKNKLLLSDALPVKAGATLVVGKDTVEVRRYRTENGGVEVTLKVPHEYGHRQSGYWHDRVRLENAKGERLNLSGNGWGRGDKVYEITVNFEVDAAKGQPAKLYVEDWQTVPYPITFEFNDIQLP